MWVLLLSPHYSKESWDSERLSNLFKVAWLNNHRHRIQPGPVWPKSSGSISVVTTAVTAKGSRCKALGDRECLRTQEQPWCWTAGGCRVCCWCAGSVSPNCPQRRSGQLSHVGCSQPLSQKMGQNLHTWPSVECGRAGQWLGSGWGETRSQAGTGQRRHRAGREVLLWIRADRSGGQIAESRTNRNKEKTGPGKPTLAGMSARTGKRISGKRISRAQVRVLGQEAPPFLGHVPRLGTQEGVWWHISGQRKGQRHF